MAKIAAGRRRHQRADRRALLLSRAGHTVTLLERDPLEASARRGRRVRHLAAHGVAQFFHPRCYSGARATSCSRGLPMSYARLLRPRLPGDRFLGQSARAIAPATRAPSPSPCSDAEP